MSESQFESVLNLFNISIEDICSRSGIEESLLYRLLSRSANPDSYTLEKLSQILCISKKEILRFLKLTPKRGDNIILFPSFTSFNKLFYIFKMCAFEEALGISLNKYFSFIPDDQFKVEYRLIQGQMTIYDSQSVTTYVDDSIVEIPFAFEQEEYIADMTKSSVLLITISN